MTDYEEAKNDFNKFNVSASGTSVELALPSVDISEDGEQYRCVYATKIEYIGTITDRYISLPILLQVSDS